MSNNHHYNNMDLTYIYNILLISFIIIVMYIKNYSFNYRYLYKYDLMYYYISIINI